MGTLMSTTAKLFMNGRSQAVRLPKEYRFNEDVVFIRRDEKTGDVILSPRPSTWNHFFDSLQDLEVPEDFLGDRHQSMLDRDPFEDAKTE